MNCWGERQCDFCRKKITDCNESNIYLRSETYLDFQNQQTRFCSKSCFNQLHWLGIQKEGMFGRVLFWMINKFVAHFKDYHSD